MSHLGFIVLTPPGVSDPGVAIAASRAGVIGMLDLEHVGDARRAALALTRLQRFTTGEIGVKFGPASAPFAPSLLKDHIARTPWVLLAGGRHESLEDCADCIRRQGLRLLFEATSLEEALLGQRLGVQGLVLKGHEAGGRIGVDTSFILLQRCLEQIELPLWIHGGVGLHTAAACQVAGATGVVLDSQLLLARESLLDDASRRRLATFDGSQTVCLGESLGSAYRCYHAPGTKAVDQLRQLESQILASEDSGHRRPETWPPSVARRIADGGLWLLGQDASMARPLADRYATVAGIVRAFEESAQQHVDAARRIKPLSAQSALARQFGTRYPIAQGPMTRVSDTPAFVEAVARSGALPFLALAMLRRDETERLLAETRARLADRPWGVGMLGFAEPEIRRQQFDAILAHRPPVVLIAGGRPDQAQRFEQEGIPTYLHVPSPELLRHFLKEGARRFIFEGRECGGHVGPRTSFVLWDAMCEVLLEHVQSNGRGDDLQLLFAGGIHDRRSAAMVAAIGAEVARQGAALGVMMGSAYVFTKEAVESGAIVSRFQQQAIGGRHTVLLASGPGHETRCLDTPYADLFRQEKARWQAEGRDPDEIREALERMNVGRLRVAAKGVDRNPEWTAEEDERRRDEEEVEKFISVADKEQHSRGMYMIGQIASLRGESTTMAELHADVCDRSTELLEELRPSAAARSTPSRGADVAVIGMSCLLPKASSLDAYWQNILQRRDAITEVPEDRWDWRLFFDPESTSGAKINSKWGGFLDDVPFDPLRYGMPPNTLGSIEPLQLLLLEAARHALDDAGYGRRPFDRERTAVILGAGGGAAQLSMAYAFQSYLPLLENVPGLAGMAPQIIEKCRPMLPEWTEDTFPGILLNVAAGRVANRFDFGGACFSVDAACGSSLAALYLGTRELQTGASDVALVMGGDTVQNPFTYKLFSTTNTFSPDGRSRPFDEAANGIVISEGIGVVVLKRLADAQRDGDRIYAVIKGVGSSADGKDRGLTAPRPEGQMRALRRAYAAAGISPGRVGLLEAHGTGTIVGDRSEAESASAVFRQSDDRKQFCALGSVKSMIGHTKCAAGLAGLIKTTLALYHKVRPPTLVDRPNPKPDLPNSPFFLNTQARPWIHGDSQPRCAAVSAFGFGGTNFHAVLEEYTGDFLPENTCALPSWPAELLVFRQPTRDGLIESAEAVSLAAAGDRPPALADLAAWLASTASPQPGDPVLAVVAVSTDDLKQKLEDSLNLLRGESTKAPDPRGIYFNADPASQSAKIAFLFPGQGSQYPDMLAELAMAFGEVRRALDVADGVLADRLDRPLGSLIFPPSAFTPEEAQAARRALMRTDVAQPAVGAASLGMFHLLGNLGLRPDFLAGHSYGDLVALCAAGAIGEEDLIRLSHRRGRALLAASEGNDGGMLAVAASSQECESALEGIDEIVVANLNAPQQVVISGTEAGLQRATKALSERNVRCRRIDVSSPFHSPWVAAAREPLAAALADCRMAAAERPVYSNTTAAPFPDDPEKIAGLLLDHVTSPVRFQAEIENMYQQGARVFLEVGPHDVLTGLVGRILEDRPHLAVASNRSGRGDLVQLQHALAQLLTEGVDVRLDHLFSSRDLQHASSLDSLVEEAAGPSHSPSTFLVNSTRVRPIESPEPPVLGQAIRPGQESPPSEPLSLPEPAAAAEPSTGDSSFANLALPDLPAGLPANALDSDDADQVMLRFQEMMSKFLDTQRRVMESYLTGSPPSMPSAESLAAELPAAQPRPQPAEAPAEAVAEPAEDAAAETAAPPAGFDHGSLTDRLLGAVSKRTGYPREMLDLDLNLEADLGIDSIKRVEILSGLLGSQGDGSADSNVEMEKLTGLRSLRDIIDYLVDATGAESKPAEPAVQSAAPDASPATVDQIRRMLVEPVAIDGPSPHGGDPASGTLLITDDGRGVANELARLLRDAGREVALVGNAHEDNGDSAAERYRADLTDPDDVERLWRRIEEAQGGVAGLIHLLPLSAAPDNGSWKKRMCREVKSLFLLARRLAVTAGKERILLAATAMGGSFGLGQPADDDSFFPGQGGVAGLVKSLAHEWSDSLVRVVDLDPRHPSAELAQRLAAELGDGEGPPEVGYRDGRRIVLKCKPAPIEASSEQAPPLGPDSTVLVTGGARGITAAVVLELARCYGCRFVLVGRSPLPPDRESSPTAGLSEPAELKAALVDLRRSEGGSVAPADIERAYHRLLRQREIRANLAAFRQSEAEVHYRQADVRDEAAFEKVIAEIEDSFGGCDGVIHGAGVIDDKLIKDKTPESFDYVFGTKLDSALSLSRLLRPEKLKFCVFFTSVAGRFGNRGQSDYAAANEVLSKLAMYLDRRWPGRVVSLAWGPWSRIGMVSDLESHLTGRGLQLIPPEIGPLRFNEELRYGRKGECEVVIAGEVGQLAAPRRRRARQDAPDAEHSDGP